jgi:NAD(P)-dependent dehydrogenase (short-subunit alcohol dehydrogenase family)
MCNRSLIVFGSEAGIWGVNNVDYAASKAALHGLVQSFAADPMVQAHGARVNLIAPGVVDTPQFQLENENDPDDTWRQLATVVQAKAVPIEAVARTCLYLASDNFSGSLTAQTIRVDGGRSGRLFHPARADIVLER